jgi:DNA-binding transcriptional regulator LsrR (DeoR family)
MSADSLPRNVWDQDRLDRLQKICQLKNKAGGAKNQKDIATELDLNETAVSRIFNEGIKDGLVHIHIAFNPPPVEQLQRELTARLKDQLIRSVYVGQTTDSTGLVAARYLEEKATSNKTVVLDGGQTVFDFVRELNLPKDNKLRIIPIAADPPSYKISAYELLTRLHAKIPSADPEKLPHFRGGRLDTEHLQIAAKAREADFVFLGAGPCVTGHTALDFVEHLGIDPVQFKRDHAKIAYMCGYCGIDNDGNEVEFNREFDLRMPRALNFKDLQSMARHPDKVVALLAKGERKLEAVSTVIKAGIINTLFLDGPLAAALLKLQKDHEPRP